MFLGSAFSAVAPFLVIAYLLAPRLLDVVKDLCSTALVQTTVKEGEDWTFVSQSSQHQSHGGEAEEAPILVDKGERIMLKRRLETLLLTLFTLLSARHLFDRFLWIPLSTRYDSDRKYYEQFSRAYEILSTSPYENGSPYMTWKKEQQVIELVDRVNIGVAFILACSVSYMIFHLLKALTMKQEHEKDKKGASAALSVEECWKQIHRKLYQSLLKPMGHHVVIITYLLLHNCIASSVLRTVKSLRRGHYELMTDHPCVTCLSCCIRFDLYVWIHNLVTFAYTLYLVVRVVMICKKIAQENQAATHAIHQDLLRLGSVVKKQELKERLKLSVVLLFTFVILRFISNMYRFDPYEILEVSPDAGELEIRRAYIRLSMRYH